MRRKITMKRTQQLFSIICFIVMLVLIFLPTGFEKQIYKNAEGVKAKVLDTNESTVYQAGLLKQGSQTCTIEILQGEFKGTQVEGVNLLTGKLELDKLYKAGDKAYVLLEKDDQNQIIYANMIDYYRLNSELLLIIIFAIGLLIFAGRTGARTILSFAFSLLCIWKILIPSLLKGYHPMFVSLCIGVTMAVVTLLLVGGFTKKAYCAILGTVSASFLTCLTAIVFGSLFKIDGAVMDWSESLLYAGFQNLNLTLIYQGAIYLACSGAIVDLTMDISAAVDEVVEKKPDLTKIEILRSGIRIGRSVVGSQITTLLLAYMGSFIAVMMVYMAQGTPLLSILNTQSIASEILHTFVGCMGLVIVSPLTALICSHVYTKPVKS